MKKIIFLNGSPRMDGNTRAILKAVDSGIDKTKYETEFIDVTKHKIDGCIDCKSCKTNGGKCILPDETNMLTEKMFAADIIILGSPVYWWGISGQAKILIDKLYCKSTEDKYKKEDRKFGIIAVGADGIQEEQYELISRQFRCIAGYLGWEIMIDKAVSAYMAGEILQKKDKIEEFVEIGKSL